MTKTEKRIIKINDEKLNKAHKIIKTCTIIQMKTVNAYINKHCSSQILLLVLLK